MKYILNITLLSILLFSCGNEKTLEDLKTEKKELETEIKAIEVKIDSLNSEIAMLDTTTMEAEGEAITVFQTKIGEYNHFVEAQGVSYAENNVMVTTDMGGLVTTIYVDEGEYVSIGKTLIQIDNAVIKNQIAEINTALTLAKDVYEKRKRLWDQNIGSEIEFLQAKNNYNSLQDKLATANTQLGKSSITAPISGYVDNINLKVGEMAAPGAPAIQVVNGNNMEVHASLPEIYLGTVKKGEKILVKFPALNIEKEATVKSVGQTISSANRTFKVIASIENKDNIIKPNLLAKIKINDQTEEKAITIPAKLLQQNSAGENFVFTVEKDSTSNETIARKRMITIGTSYDGMVLVNEGLSTGEKLVADGYRNVRDGKIVSIKK